MSTSDREKFIYDICNAKISLEEARRECDRFFPRKDSVRQSLDKTYHDIFSNYVTNMFSDSSRDFLQTPGNWYLGTGTTIEEETPKKSRGKVKEKIREVLIKICYWIEDKADKFSMMFFKIRDRLYDW